MRFVVFCLLLILGVASQTLGVVIQKCCHENEVMYMKRKSYTCSLPAPNTSEDALLKPIFSERKSLQPLAVSNVTVTVGQPPCTNSLMWIILEEKLERFYLLDDGSLLHYTTGIADGDKEERRYEYKLGSYCLDNLVSDDQKTWTRFASVCFTPATEEVYERALIILVLDTLFHGIAIICYTSVAIIHFVLPQLRDLVGNIITTMCLCLVAVQAADLMRLFTDLENISHLVADAIMFVSIVGSFFWLNSFGFYIWNTFRSRNVFLRITDGRKYCYYSMVVWASTITMSILAIFSHFTLELQAFQSTQDDERETIGLLGTAVFFSPVGFTIIINIYFYASTTRKIKRMSTYGRIHHKLKLSFDIFCKLFIIMTLAWLTFLLNFLDYDLISYTFLIINALQAPLILYVSVLSQKRVRFLLKKVCCYEECFCTCCRPDQTDDAPEWGEEMLAMNQ